jgi:hypothetical protein
MTDRRAADVFVECLEAEAWTRDDSLVSDARSRTSLEHRR